MLEAPESAASEPCSRRRQLLPFERLGDVMIAPTDGRPYPPSLPERSVTMNIVVPPLEVSPV
jgi:hypothetical protein